MIITFRTSSKRTYKYTNSCAILRSYKYEAKKIALNKYIVQELLYLQPLDIGVEPFLMIEFSSYVQNVVGDVISHIQRDVLEYKVKVSKNCNIEIEYL